MDFYDLTFKMSEASNFQPLGRRNRKKLNLESIVAEAESLLASQAGNFQPGGKTNRKNLWKVEVRWPHG